MGIELRPKDNEYKGCGMNRFLNMFWKISLKQLMALRSRDVRGFGMCITKHIFIGVFYDGKEIGIK